MPNSNPFTSQEIYRNRPKVFKIAIFVLLFVLAAVAAYWSTSGRGLPTFTGSSPSSKELVNEDNTPGEKFYEDLVEREYSEIKTELDQTDQTFALSPNISDQSVRERVDQIVGNTEPQNVIVAFTEEGLSNDYVILRQGDLVTWRNNSESGLTMMIQGESWGTFSPRPTGTGFSQRFDFLGIYNYTISHENGVLEAIVEVRRAE